ncbi:putative holin-like toxin [Brochothrix thermosphacta]
MFIISLLTLVVVFIKLDQKKKRQKL